MNPISGSRLGGYEIVESVGAGGMGEVYRARDTVLNRDVALKVLPENFVRDPDRLARFEREAQVLAALNHPNIAAIHGVEQSGGVRALVMEFVSGRTLEDVIHAGRTNVADAIAIARQIALALEAAHEQGIIHRDLKPANVKLRDDGTVKVLDFGLAKAMDPAGGGTAAQAAMMHSPTLTERGTQIGMIIGTAAYMAPEQARGRVVDRRADIWSFGVVLAELLTGARAFKGDDISEVLAKVIEREPDLSNLPASTPPSLRRLIARCLEKDPKQRLRDVGEARIALDEAQREITQGAASVVAVAPSLDARRWRAVPWALAAALGLAVLVLLMGGSASAPPAPVTRVQIALPPGIELYTSVAGAVSVSPDGSTLAVVGVKAGVRQVFLRRFDQFEVTPVRGSESAIACVFSPDGRDVLVGMSDTSLRRIRLSDGLVEVVAPITSEYQSGWLHNGRVVFTKEGRLWMSGGTPGAAQTRLTDGQAGSTEFEARPVSVPGHDAILFVAGRVGAPDAARIDALSLADRTRTTVVERASAPLLTRTGHLLFLRDGVLLAAAFDSRALKIVGEAAPVLRDMTIVRNRGVSPILTVSDTGVLVYASTSAVQSEIVSVSRLGDERTVLNAGRPAANPRLSSDGRLLMFEEVGGGLWVQDRDRRTLARLTDGTTLAAFPIFTRDGRDAVFRSPSGLFRQRLDGGAKPEQIAGTEASEFPTGFTPDGTTLIYTKITATTTGDIYTIPLAGGVPRVVLSTPAYEGGAQISPDGRWMVYVSNEPAGSEIFLQPYPALDRRIQVSSAGGIQPIWNPKGGEIFYRSGDQLMSVRLTVTPAGVVLTPPSPLFSGRYAYGGGLTIPNFGVASDGEHFILVKEHSGATLNVVLNWFEELRRAAPGR